MEYNKPEVFHKNLTKYSTSTTPNTTANTHISASTSANALAQKKSRHSPGTTERSISSKTQYEDSLSTDDKNASNHLSYMKNIQPPSLANFTPHTFNPQFLPQGGTGPGPAYYPTSPKFILNSGSSSKQEPTTRIYESISYPIVSQKYYSDNTKTFLQSGLNYGMIQERNPSKPPTFFNETKLISEIFDCDRSKKLNMQFISKVDKGFFYCKDGWACYRRNYFQISCSFTIFNEDGTFYNKNRPITVFDPATQQFHTVNEFVVGLFGIDLNTRKKVELVQNTAKRDKTSRKQPNFLPISNKSESLVPGIVSNQSIATFSRIQFKNSTVNQSRRSITQQYYIIEIGLFAIIGNGTQMLVATSTSRPLIVRGRSPGYYTDNHKYVSPFSQAPKEMPDSHELPTTSTTPYSIHTTNTSSMPMPMSMSKYESTYPPPDSLYMNKTLVPYSQVHHTNPHHSSNPHNEGAVHPSQTVQRYGNTMLDPSSKLIFTENRIDGYQYSNYNYDFKHPPLQTQQQQQQSAQSSLIDESYVLMASHSHESFKPSINQENSHSQNQNPNQPQPQYQSQNPNQGQSQSQSVDSIPNSSVEPIFAPYGPPNINSNIQPYPVSDFNPNLKNYPNVKYNHNLNTYSYVNHNRNLNSFHPQ